MPDTPGTVLYPTALDSADSLMRAANNAADALNGGITGSATSLTLNDAAEFPASGSVTIENEIIYYTAKSGNQLTGLVRGQDGTTAAAHSSGVAVKGNHIARHHNVLSDAIQAIETKLGIGATIDAAKIHDGSVSNTEFGHLNGVTSAIQSQLDSKAGINATDGVVPYRSGDGALSDSQLIRAGANELHIRNGANSQKLFFAHDYTDASNYDGLLIEGNYEGTNDIGIRALKAGSGTQHNMWIGTAGAGSVIFITSGAQSVRINPGGSVDFNYEVFVPDLYVGLNGTGAQHRIIFYNNTNTNYITAKGRPDVLEIRNPDESTFRDVAARNYFVNSGFIGDGNGNELLKFSQTASAVNEVTVTNAAAGSGPTISATGGDTNIDLLLAGKGTGVVKVGGVEVGFRNIPQNSQSAAYTAVLADSGKHILHPSSDNNPRTFTIPSNASVAYPIGTAITFVNKINTLTIAITSDTLTMAGTGSTGSRALAANGIATAVKIAATEWIISGTGLT